MDSSYWIWTLLPIVGGIIISVIMNASVRAPGQALSKRFAELGDLRGRTLQEIVNHCGQYNSIFYNTDEEGNPINIIEWMATGYLIVLLFDENDICIGISSESSV